MLASGNMLAVTRVSVTISTLSVKGRQSARLEIEQEHESSLFFIFYKELKYFLISWAMLYCSIFSFSKPSLLP